MSGKLTALQSLRGLCCLVVVIHHCFMSLGEADDYGLWFYALNPHAAIVVFFVLSGFVLSLARVGAPITGLQVLRFYGLRLARIYPALIVSGLVYVVLYKLVLPWPVSSSASDWLVNVTDPERLSQRKVVQSVLGLSTALQPPLWTIAVEIAISAVVPMMWWACRTLPGCLALAALTLALSFVNVDTPLSIHVYVFCFVVGVIGATLYKRLSLHDLPSIPTVPLYGALFLLYGALISVRYGLGSDLYTDYNAPLASAAESLLAGLIIVLIALTEKKVALFKHASLLWIGDISYSMYLLHFAGILIVFHAADRLGATMHIGTLLAFAVPLTLLASATLYSVVELPFLEAARQKLSGARRAVGWSNAPR